MEQEQGSVAHAAQTCLVWLDSAHEQGMTEQTLQIGSSLIALQLAKSSKKRSKYLRAKLQVLRKQNLEGVREGVA